jgi:hypothetical protein
MLSYVLNLTYSVTVLQLLTPSPLVLLNKIPYKLQQLLITSVALNAMPIHQTDRWLATTSAGTEYDKHGVEDWAQTFIYLHSITGKRL